ncbi:hypothetical protein [Winogradskyella helgolandensis]|uniref:hypothetical protein n=1 Tax=Winogradskyella helgolandensis TaxID=2697010 RepID=UPI0015C7B6B7|nr:hypothetical protein [Winogradskyella helgolandensis]
MISFVKSYSISKDTIALLAVTMIVLGLFLSGLFDVLDYLIIKALLFFSFGTLFILACIYAIKNDTDTEKNRPEEALQNDSN